MANQLSAVVAPLPVAMETMETSAHLSFCPIRTATLWACTFLSVFFGRVIDDVNNKWTRTTHQAPLLSVCV
jgi:hypothetical protein